MVAPRESCAACSGTRKAPELYVFGEAALTSREPMVVEREKELLRADLY